MNKVLRIRIPATYFLHGVRKDEVADFAVGPGPCGKEVKTLRLSTEVNSGYITVDQHTDCGEFKQFLYRESDLIGRVEVTYG